MQVWESGEVTANGLRLHYTRTGGDKPPLVLAHGITDSGLCWSPVAAALAPDYDAIMVDARGHGRSAAPREGYGPAAQAADLAELIAALGLRQPAVLGHSMGAATALVLAGTYPELPGAILLEDPPSWWTDWYESPGGTERRTEMRTRFLALKRKTRPELIAEQRAAQPGWSDAELEAWAEAKQCFSLDVLSVLEPENASGVAWRDLLPRITCPALLITADPTLGAIVTTASAAALQALVPHLEIAHVPDAGHSVRRDQFARYMTVVHAFLANQQVGAESRGGAAAGDTVDEASEQSFPASDAPAWAIGQTYPPPPAVRATGVEPPTGAPPCGALSQPVPAATRADDSDTARAGDHKKSAPPPGLPAACRGRTTPTPQMGL
jgi:pimeloyl-ACP methyl ester carboxylesterase